MKFAKIEQTYTYKCVCNFGNLCFWVIGHTWKKILCGYCEPEKLFEYFMFLPPKEEKILGIISGYSCESPACLKDYTTYEQP